MFGTVPRLPVPRLPPRGSLGTPKILSTGATLDLGPICLHVENWEGRTLKSSARCQKFGVPCWFFSACKWGFRPEPIRSLHLFKHDIAKGRTRVLWDRHLDSSQFFRLLLRLQVFRSITLNIMIQTLCTVMQLFKGSYLTVDAASKQRTYLQVVFHLEYKRSYIFKALPMKQ